MNHKELRMYLALYNSIENEIAIDEYCYKILGVDFNLYFIPRPFRANDIVRRFSPSIGGFFARNVRRIWSNGGFFLYLLAIFVQQSVWKIIFLSDKFPDSLEDKKSIIFIQFSNLSPLESLRAVLGDKEVLVLSAPWIRKSGKTYPLNMPRTSLASALSWADLVKIAIYSIKAWNISRSRKRKKISSWSLSFFVTPNWFLAWIVLEKLNSDLVTMEHFDRWAILLDRLQREKLRHGDSRQTLTMIQHGSVEGVGEKLQLPNRIKFVDTLYTFDAPSKQCFLDEIFDLNRLNRSPVLTYYFFPKFQLSPTNGKDEEIKVLFVGHPACIDIQLKIHKYLVANHRVYCYYKPHPRSPAPRDLESAGWAVVYDSEFFPKVNLVISYPSTLVTEYSSVGILCFEHSFDGDDVYLDEVLKEIACIMKTI